MFAYNPFEKSLSEIDAADLIGLRTVNEGWYVEYKREVPKAEVMAKSISAFANTHGGWLFIGITEKSKEESVAEAFPGIPGAEVDVALQRLRQAVAGAIAPSPHFDVRAVWGPNIEIGLEEGRAVICVQVPKGPNAPYIHRSGQIYRRIGDGSEPRPETDRFILDQLWHRSDNLLKSYERWHGRDPELSEAEDEQPFIRLMLATDLWGDRGANLDAEITEVRRIFANSTPIISGIPFDTVYHAADGFTARQQANNDPSRYCLTWHLARDLASDVIIPLNSYVLNQLADYATVLQGYETAKYFGRVLTARRFQRPQIVDLNFLFNALMGIVEIQNALLKRAGWVHGFHMKAILLNVWRTVPFIDMPSVIEEFERCGVPVVMQKRIVSLPGHHPDTFKEIHRYPESDPKLEVILQALSMLRPIAAAYGISFPSEGDAFADFLTELASVGDAAQKNQAERGKRSTF